MKLTKENIIEIESILEDTYEDYNISNCKITTKAKNEDKLELKMELVAHYELKDVIQGSSLYFFELYKICDLIKIAIEDIAKFRYELDVNSWCMENTSDQSYSDDKRSAKLRIDLDDGSEIEIEVCVTVVYKENDLLRKINNIIYNHFRIYTIKRRRCIDINDKSENYKRYIEISLIEDKEEMTFKEINKKIYSLIKPLFQTNKELDNIEIQIQYLQDFEDI